MESSSRKLACCIVLSDRVDLGRRVLERRATSTDVTDGRRQPTCTYALSTTSFNVAGAGGTAIVQRDHRHRLRVDGSSNARVRHHHIRDQPDRATARVNLTVSENTGDARIGTLTVAGQTVIVSQAPAIRCTATGRGTIVKGAGCPATLPASVDVDRHDPPHRRRELGVRHHHPLGGRHQPGHSADRSTATPAVLRPDRHALHVQRDARAAIADRSPARSPAEAAAAPGPAPDSRTGATG